MSTAQKALAYAISKLGCQYSQSKRMNKNPDIFDCSSLVYRAFLAADYKFQTDQNTSCYLCYDPNFDRLWPEAGKTLGKQFTSIATFKKNGYKPQPGDIIYLNTDSKTTRSNKITHVVMVENESKIVHARGASYGVRRDSIDLYGEKVVAVTRYREPAIVDLEGDNLSPIVRAATCTGDGVNIRNGRNSGTESLGKVNKGHLLVAGEPLDNWVPVATVIGIKPVAGYMFKDYVSK